MCCVLNLYLALRLLAVVTVLPTAYCLLPIAYECCLLPIAFCLLSTADLPLNASLP